MKNKNFLFLFLLSIFFGNLANAAPADNAQAGLQKYDNVVTVSPTRGKVISNEFWGTNLLSWENTDLSLKNGEKQLLAEIPIQLLRYPGGTVADNFDWRTATLYNKKMFPKEDGPNTTDFNEFMALCKEINAEPILVVNTQRFFYMDSVAAGAKLAADWVQYCKDHDFKVKYWEIGNETALHHIISAQEYANLVKVYAAAMKAVDPSITIFANGECRSDDAGAKDEVKPAFRQAILDEYKAAELANPQYAPRSKEEIKEDLKEQGGSQAGVNSPRWWPTVAAACSDTLIDGYVIHYYFGTASHKNKNPADYPNEEINVGQVLMKTRRLIETTSGRNDLQFALTEYNCNNDNAKYAAVGLAEALGRFIECGVDISNFWPFTFGSFSDGVMINRDANNKKQYPYFIFKIMSEIFTGQRVECTHNQALNYYAIASHSDNNDAVMITNAGTKSINITIDLSQFADRAALQSQNIAIAQYANDRTDKLTSNFIKHPVSYKIGDGFLNVTIKNQAVLFLNLQNNAPQLPAGADPDHNTEPNLLAKFDFTQSNDFVAGYVADGVEVSDLEIGEGLISSREEDLLKISNWEKGVNIKNNKRYIGLAINSEPGKTFQVTSFSVEHKGNLKSFQLNQGASLEAGQFTTSLQITGDKNSLLQRIITIPEDKLLHDQTDLYLSIGAASDNASTNSADWVNNFAKISTIKFFGTVNSASNVEDVQMGTLTVIGKTVLLSELNAKNISVYNISGSLVKQIQVNGTSAQFNLNDSGIYIIRLESEKSVATCKALIH